MKTNEDMTPTEAAGYISGLGLCFLRRFYRVIAILLAFAGLALMLTNFSFTVTSNSFSLRFGEFAQLGLVMLVMSIALWLVFKPRHN